MKSVLVTGASGFIGRAVLDFLQARGFIVHALFNEHPLEHQPNVKWHQVNLLDVAAVQALLETLKPSHLLHLAWYAKPKEYWQSPLNIQWLKASLDLLEMFSRCGGERAVFIGTCAEYDWQYEYLQEFVTPCKPSTLYGSSKYALSLLAEQMTKLQGISFSWARIFFLFGEFEAPGRLVSSGIEHLLRQQIFEVAQGSKQRDFLYVQDVASALAALLDSRVVGPVNIASGQAITIRELMHTIAIKLDKLALLHFKETEAIHEPATLHADVRRLREEVRWSPQYSLDQALERTIQWWQSAYE